MRRSSLHKDRVRTTCIAFLLLAAALVISACNKDDPSASTPTPPDISGTWEGLASDDGQLGTSGLSVFTFQLSQSGENVSGPVTVRKAAFADTYASTLTAKLAVENSIWVLRGSFDFQIGSCNVHVTFSAVNNSGSLVGNHGGTNSCLGNITGGSFVLNKK